MKKLIVLSLFVAIASLATAGLSKVNAPASVEAGSSFTIDIIGNGQMDNDSIYVWISGDATMSGGTNNIVDGEIYIDQDSADFLADDYGYNGYINGQVLWADISIPKATPAVISGNILSGITVTVGADAAGTTLTVYVLNENDGTIQASQLINVVPEPMTLGLLGLGGLFLRRRK
jgi:hypothetical protein